MTEQKELKIPVCVSKGNKGIVVDIDGNNITGKRHNGIMNILYEFKVKISDIERILKEYKQNNKRYSK